MPTNDNHREVRNGRDLVARILNHPRGGVAALLRLSERQETEWLEFKAALHPEGGHFEVGTKQADYDWHVAKATVAMANSVGGAVILGLDDDIHPIGLIPSDPNHTLNTKGREAFNRQVVQKALVCKEWKTGRNGTIQLGGDLNHLIDIRNADYQGHYLVVILVSPVPDDELLEVTENHNNRERVLTPVRARGALGQVLDLQGRKVRDHELARASQLQGDDFDRLWQRFLSSLPSEVEPPDLINREVENALADYNQACVKIWRGLQDIFTPLDLEESRTIERLAHVGEFVPEAEEWHEIFASDDPWDASDGAWHDDEDTGEDAAPVPPNPPLVPLRRGGVFDLLAQEPRAILLGEPGAGKSTCLKRLALEQASKYKRGKTIALYVPLRRYDEQGLTALLTRVSKQPRPVLDALIRAGRLNLLLDAINECRRDFQERCCQDIMALLDAHPSLPVIVTARNLGYRCQLGLPTFIVRPLDREQQKRFLTIYLRDGEFASHILKCLMDQPGGDLLTSSPLLLSMAVKVARSQGGLPQGRAQLYRCFMEDWYEWENKKGNKSGAPLRWSFACTREALAHLAFSCRKAGLVDIGRIEAKRILHPLLMEDTTRFLERMAQGLLLSLDNDSDTLRFSHDSIQDYFAAEYIISYPDCMRKLHDSSRNLWDLTIVYLFDLEHNLIMTTLRAIWKINPFLVLILCINKKIQLTKSLLESSGDSIKLVVNYHKDYIGDILSSEASAQLESTYHSVITEIFNYHDSISFSENIGFIKFLYIRCIENIPKRLQKKYTEHAIRLGIIDKKDIPLKIVNGWLEEIVSLGFYNQINVLCPMVKSGLISDEDIPDLIKKGWIASIKRSESVDEKIKKAKKISACNLLDNKYYEDDLFNTLYHVLKSRSTIRG